MGFEIRKAERSKLPARVGIAGPSGSGKTYSSLLLARGLVGPKGRICVIDSEQGSSNMYSDVTDFDVLELGPPYSPKRYVAAIEAVEAAEYDALIVDQISNAWAGEGGVLEFVDKKKASGGGRAGFSAWKDAGPMQRKFVERILAFTGHLIVTMRSKVEWVVERENGKNVPRKVGMSPVQRDGIEYEFQIMLDLSNDGNTAEVSKDRTSLFYGESFTPSIEVGAKLREFLSSGQKLKEKREEVPAPEKAEKEKAPPKEEQEDAPEPVEESKETPSEDDGPTIDADTRKRLIALAKKEGQKQADVAVLLKEHFGIESLRDLKVSDVEAFEGHVKVPF